jgi:hypothetical protein
VLIPPCRRTSQAPAYNEWQRQQQAKVNLNQPVGLFKDMVASWPQRLPGMEVEVKAMNQNALPPFVFPDGASSCSPVCAPVLWRGVSALAGRWSDPVAMQMSPSHPVFLEATFQYARVGWSPGPLHPSDRWLTLPLRVDPPYIIGLSMQARAAGVNPLAVPPDQPPGDEAVPAAAAPAPAGADAPGVGSGPAASSAAAENGRKRPADVAAAPEPPAKRKANPAAAPLLATDAAADSGRKRPADGAAAAPPAKRQASSAAAPLVAAETAAENGRKRSADGAVATVPPAKKQARSAAAALSLAPPVASAAMAADAAAAQAASDAPPSSDAARAAAQAEPALKVAPLQAGPGKPPGFGKALRALHCHMSRCGRAAVAFGVRACPHSSEGGVLVCWRCRMADPAPAAGLLRRQGPQPTPVQQTPRRT